MERLELPEDRVRIELANKKDSLDFTIQELAPLAIRYFGGVMFICGLIRLAESP